MDSIGTFCKHFNSNGTKSPCCPGSYDPVIVFPNLKNARRVFFIAKRSGTCYNEIALYHNNFKPRYFYCEYR